MNFTSGNYPKVLSELKSAIRQGRLKASISANSQMLLLYWQIGKTIVNQQETANWGAKIIQQLALDLRKEFPDMQGISARNLKYMRQFAATYPDFTIGQRAVAQLSWSHHVILMDKIKEPEQRDFYINKTVENGWSRDVLSLQIKSSSFKRSGKAVTNFEDRLPPLQSDLAKQVTKDPYIFDFLSLNEKYHEKDLEYAGKLNFYLSVVDDVIRTELDQPSIGLLICQDKDKVTAEYALKDVNKPIGISEYHIAENIPKNLKGKLPTIQELEKELEALSIQNSDDTSDI